MSGGNIAIIRHRLVYLVVYRLSELMVIWMVLKSKWYNMPAKVAKLTTSLNITDI